MKGVLCGNRKTLGLLHPSSSQENQLPPLAAIGAEALAQSATHESLPQEIDNRKRALVDVVAFSTKSMLLDLLSDQRAFGDLSNLVVNTENAQPPPLQEHF